MRARKSVSIIHLEIYLIALVLAHKADTHKEVLHARIPTHALSAAGNALLVFAEQFVMNATHTLAHALV